MCPCCWGNPLLVTHRRACPRQHLQRHCSHSVVHQNKHTMQQLTDRQTDKHTRVSKVCFQALRATAGSDLADITLRYHSTAHSPMTP